MSISVAELFKIGLGPSSSHTMGPMIAARRFVSMLEAGALARQTSRIVVNLYGSLALTGKGHATDTAVMLGLQGVEPDRAEPAQCDRLLAETRQSGRLTLPGGWSVPFCAAADLAWHGQESLAFHPNGLRFAAFDGSGMVLLARSYYSIGGGFVLDEDETKANAAPEVTEAVPFPFTSANELLEMADRAGLAIWQLALANEDALRPREHTDELVQAILRAMDEAIARGLSQEGELPGGLGVRRRASGLRRRFFERLESAPADPLATLDLVNLWAIAVNEENAAGGRVVTAPTNGAAGIIPAVLRYAETCHRAGLPEKTRFLLTATAIGGLYKRNASLSAAEVGCQGEVGVACSMAAAGLAAIMGGSNAQIENAAEIGMEHNLGLTCDPIGGLVQIPCIERNAMGAVKAIDAARLALSGSGSHLVSLDQVIDTMRRTGADMASHYKETSLGGLAVCVPAC